MFEHIEEKEAVKKAALIEVNGYRFYTLLSEKTHNRDVKAAFKKLAHDEKRHLKIIENVYYPEAGFGTQITDEELAIEGYVEKSAAPDIFARRIDVDSLVEAIDSTKKALTFALNTERHSVEYFETLSKRARTPEGRKIYTELAEEERSHVAEIEGLLKANP